MEADPRRAPRAEERAASIARLRRAVATGGPGAATLKAVLTLVGLGAREAAGELRALAERLGGSPGAIALAAAFLVEEDTDGLAAAITADPILARSSPQAYFGLARLPAGAPRLFSAWLVALERASTSLGVTAYRAFVGDVAEAAFRALQKGASAEVLLAERRGFLVDVLCAELPGTTDFLAARGMAWLLGALAPSDDAARAAIERAGARFRDPGFQRDCTAILAGQTWPPVVP